MTHIMLDLETWGTEPGCDLRSIGALRFDPVTGHICERTSAGAFYLALDNPLIDTYLSGDRLKPKYPLHRDPKTVEWWGKQSDEAQTAFAGAVDMRVGLTAFADWLRLQCPDPTHLRLWAHGPFFDHRLLAAVYAVIGLDAPWHYRSVRDTRTVFEVAGFDPSYCLSMFTDDTMTFHHALDDCIVQARAVCASWAAIRSLKP